MAIPGVNPTFEAGQKRNIQQRIDEGARSTDRDRRFYEQSMQREEGLVPDGYGGFYDPRNPLGEGGSPFAGSWDSFIGSLSGMGGDLGKYYDQAFGYLKDAKGGVDKMYSMADQFQQEFDQYTGRTSGLRDTALQSAEEDITARAGMRSRLEGGAEEDLGVAQRAIKDVEGMADRRRQQEARRKMSLGIDPTSQGFGRDTSEFSTKAAGVLGANQARDAEKQRANQFALMAYNAIDPSVSANIASNIQSQGNQLLGARGNMVSGAQGAQTNLAGTAAGMAGSYAGAQSNMADTAMKGMRTMADLYGSNAGYGPGSVPSRGGYVQGGSGPGSIPLPKGNTASSAPGMFSRGKSVQGPPGMMLR